MSDEFKAEIRGSKELVEKLNLLGPKKAGSVVKAAFRQVLEKIRAYVVSSKLSGNPIRRRTGRLASSIRVRMGIESDDTTKGEVVAGGATARGDVKYASILEYGGTIRPVNKKFLTIPIGDALTPAGVGRFSAGQLFKSPGSFGFSNAVVLGGIVYGVKAQKTQSRLTPLFILKSSVTIRPRFFMRKSLRELVPTINRDFTELASRLADMARRGAA